jgi:hypothetical protein
MTRSTGGPGGAGSGAEIDHPGTARSRLGARQGRHACLPGGGARGNGDGGVVGVARLRIDDQQQDSVPEHCSHVRD